MKAFILILIVSSLTLTMSAQTRAFELFKKAVKEEKGGLNGNKEHLSTVFNEERTRLGADFESELWKYLGNDVEKLYWAGYFLQSKSYLHGSAPLSRLAFDVWQKALEIETDKTNQDTLERRFTLLIITSVLAQKLGNTKQALQDKNEAIKIRGSDTKKYLNFPVMSAEDRCIYQNIDAEPERCKENTQNKETYGKIDFNAVIDGAAIELPKPIYPDELKKKKMRGTVEVEILISEEGNVISAKAVSGPQELFAYAVEAAKRSRFVPTIISGKAERVSGVISFNF